MDNSMHFIPVYRQFIFFINKGFSALQDKQQKEIRQFIHSCQHISGAFTDRAGTPDYYYSLFGAWLSVALGMDSTLEKHKQFILQPEKNNNNPVGDLAALMIKASVLDAKFRTPPIIRMLKMAFLKNWQVSFIYRLFMFVLLADALYSQRLLIPTARGIMFFVSPPAGSPSSIWAAYLVARKKAGFNVSGELKTLFEFFDEYKGFKAYKEMAEADLLSTAVALYALQYAGADLRNIAPDCLELIQQNYCEGAFLAGNGDEAHDLEYTFYGLLALGILV